MPHPEICENMGRRLRLGADGALSVEQDGAFLPYDFNAAYAGYYPACRFTALAAGSGLFYVAGLDEAGRPHLFTSISGGVWDERPLAAVDRLGGRIQTCGRVVRIVYADALRQALLITDAGQVVTLPDCPKCLRIHAVSGVPVDARLAGDMLEIELEGGAWTRLPLNTLSQYRVSWSFADQLVRRGATVVDLRESGEFARGHLPGSVNVPFAELSDWLRARSRGEALLFLCRTGLLADEAADHARAGGWLNAYSMGGLNTFGHID